MSRAFTKEGDSSEDPPERPVSGRPNYVTPAGLAALKDRLDQLSKRRAELTAVRPDAENELKIVDRDLRYFEARVASAILVDHSRSHPQDIRFGATVELEGGSGVRIYSIVGEDEADFARGKLGWSSPLALSLLGAKLGDLVAEPGGEGRLKVVSIRY